jgi:hypothetical protein
MTFGIFFGLNSGFELLMERHNNVIHISHSFEFTLCNLKALNPRPATCKKENMIHIVLIAHIFIVYLFLISSR